MAIRLVDKYKKIPKSIKASFYIFIASFINSAMSFLTTPIFTRILSVSDYGLINQYNSWLSIITVFATLSLSSGVYQVAMNEFKYDRDSYTFSSLILSNIVTTAIFSIFFAFGGFFTQQFELPMALLILMFIYLMLYPAMTMWLARQRYEYNYIKVVSVSVSSAIISQLAAVITVLTIKSMNLGIVKAWTTGGVMALFSLFIYISIGHKANWKVNWRYVKYALVFNLPLLAHYLSQHLLRSTDKIMITRFLGTEATGIYGLGATIANIAVLAWSAMSASLTPYIYEKLNIRDYKKINRAVIGVESFFAACCILVAIIGPEVVYILGSDKYMDGIYLIPPIAASSLLTAVYSFYSSIAFYHHKRTSTAVMTMIAAASNIVLNYIFIPIYGYVAAAYTTEASYLIYTILHYLNYKHIVKDEKVYNDFAVFGIVIATTVICIVSGTLYDHIIVRYSLVLIILCIGTIMRKQILSFAKELLKK